MAKIDVGDIIIIALRDGSIIKERRGVIIDKHKRHWKHPKKEWSYTVEWLDNHEQTTIYESEKGIRWFKRWTTRKNK